MGTEVPSTHFWQQNQKRYTGTPPSIRFHQEVPSKRFLLIGDSNSTLVANHACVHGLECMV